MEGTPFDDPNPVTNAFLCVKFLHSKRKQRILSILPLNWHARAGRYSEGRVGPDEELSLNLGGIIDKSLSFLPLWWVKMVYKLLLWM